MSRLEKGRVKKKKSTIIRHTIFLILAMTSLLVGILSVTVKPKAVRLIESAIVLDEPILLPENEGEIVIIEGIMTVNASLQEPVFGFCFDVPVVRMTAEQYTYKKNHNRYTPGTGRWEWVFDSEQACTTPAFIGEFELDSALLSQIPTPVSVTHKDVEGQFPSLFFTTEDRGKDYFSTSNISDASQTNGTLYEGSRRYSYAIPRSGAIYTVIGVQENGCLTVIEDIGEASLEVGAVGAEGMIDGVRFFKWSVLMVALPMTALFLCCGFWRILFDRPKVKRERSSASR